jgi:transcriptional regulator with XRE-family HTH domain
MTTTEFGELLRSTRESSRWPELPDFAEHAKVSMGGYRKYENGERIPSPQMLEQIIANNQVSLGVADRLRAMRDDLQINKMQLSMGQPPSALPATPADVDKLARRIHSEVLYVLKQAGIQPNQKTQRVLKKRISLILNAVLED